MIMWHRNTPIYYYTKKIPYTPITWNMETFSLDDKFDFCFVDYKVARPGEKVIVNNDIYVVSNYIYDTNNDIIEVLLDIPKRNPQHDWTVMDITKVPERMLGSIRGINDKEHKKWYEFWK